MNSGNAGQWSVFSPSIFLDLFVVLCWVYFACQSMCIFMSQKNLDRFHSFIKIEANQQEHTCMMKILIWKI